MSESTANGSSDGTRLEPGRAAKTKLDKGRSRGSGLAPARVPVPNSLSRRFEAVGALGERGAEADLILVRELRTRAHELRVVKLYGRREGELDADRVERLRDADPAHVAPVREAAEEGEPYYWELLDYYELGSLAELIDRSRGESEKKREKLARTVVGELADAIGYLHSKLDIYHRDLKPSNVLIRAADPLDLVLADFGLSRVADDQTLIFRDSSHRTPAYSAPELAAGVLHERSDWWSLGMIAAEIVGGRHPFAPDGGSLRDRQISGHLELRRAIDLSAVEAVELKDAERWVLLCRGLLLYDTDHRWGEGEVRSWLAGESPEVHRDKPESSGVSPEPFPFPDPETGKEREYRHPVELAGALAADWDRAAEVIEGRDRRRLAALRSFLRGLRLEGAEELLAADETAEARLVRLLRALDPAIEPVFRDQVLDPEGLRALAARATEGGSASETLEAVYEGRVLRAYATPEGERSSYAALDTAWSRDSERLDQALGGLDGLLPERGLPELRAAARSRVLLALLDEGELETLRAQAEEARADAEALQQDWFRQIAESDAEGTEAAQLVLLVLLREVAAGAARVEAEEELRQSHREPLIAERERLTRIQNSATNPRVGGCITTLLLAGAFFAWLGFLYHGPSAQQNPKQFHTTAIFGLILLGIAVVWILARVQEAGRRSRVRRRIPRIDAELDRLSDRERLN